ncbi:hypothetical protein DSD19_19605 [Rhodovulum sp. BSW8]|nr:hypothetical protein DSD19_19605 [Rhodovulum sp. BSW8]
MKVIALRRVISNYLFYPTGEPAFSFIYLLSTNDDHLISVAQIVEQIPQFGFSLNFIVSLCSTYHQLNASVGE